MPHISLRDAVTHEAEAIGRVVDYVEVFAADGGDALYFPEEKLANVGVRKPEKAR